MAGKAKKKNSVSVKNIAVFKRIGASMLGYLEGAVVPKKTKENEPQPVEISPEKLDKLFGAKVPLVETLTVLFGFMKSLGDDEVAAPVVKAVVEPEVKLGPEDAVLLEAFLVKMRAQDQTMSS